MSMIETVQSHSFPVAHSVMDRIGQDTKSSYHTKGGMNDMVTSSEVINNIRLELRPVEDQIRNHPIFQLLGERKVDLPTLRVFPGHQYHIINSDLRSIAMMIHRFSEPSAQTFFVQVLQGEIEAFTNLSPLAQKLGMTEEDLKGYPLMPEAFAYSTYMGWLSMYGSAAEIVAGFQVNFAAWGENCGRMSQSLKDHYGFAQEDTVFLDAFAHFPSFEAVALPIVQDGLNNGVAPEQILRAASLFQGYEKMFWDAMDKLMRG